MLFPSFIVSSTLFVSTYAAAVANRAIVADQKTVYNIWSREVLPYKGTREPYQGLEIPFRRNGTWIDINTWMWREDVLALEPFKFTLGPGINNNSYTITDVDSGMKLAYTVGNLSLPVNYGVDSAFILTTGGNTKSQVIDHWSLQTDKYGRVLLGLSQISDEFTDIWMGGGFEWTGQLCGWTGSLCDGTWFVNCGKCYGTPAVIEVLEKKK